jgi:hypothetical protein
VTRRTGRPARADRSAVRSELVAVRLTPGERDALERRAELELTSVGELLRRAALQPPSDPGKADGEPDV